MAIAEIRAEWLTEKAIKEVETYSENMANYLRELGKKPNDYQPFNHPQHWAAFICLGNPSGVE